MGEMTTQDWKLLSFNPHITRKLQYVGRLKVYNKSLFQSPYNEEVAMKRLDNTGVKNGFNPHITRKLQSL